MRNLKFDKMGNSIINASGVDVTWKKIDRFTDPDYGSTTEKIIDEKNIIGIFQDISEARSFEYPGKVPDFDAIIYAKYTYDFSIDDIIVRNDIEYKIKEINDSHSYKELALERVGG